MVDRISTAAPKTQERLPNEEAHCLKGHEGPVLAVRFNRSGTYCLSCGKVLPHNLILHSKEQSPAMHLEINDHYIVINSSFKCQSVLLVSNLLANT